MLIDTTSRRLRLATRIARLFPIAVSGRFVRRLYPWSLARRENAGFVVRSALGDVDFAFPRAEGVASGFAIRGFSEWRNVVIANVLCRSGDTIVEVGAHLGTETLLYALIVGDRGRVVAFEPLPANFATLRAGVERNHLNQVTLHQAAVATSSGRLAFYEPRDEQEQALGTLLAGTARTARAIEVDVVALDDLYQAGRLTPPRLIIIDAEGTEPDVLQGADRLIRDAHPHLVLEVDPELLAIAHVPPEMLHTRLREHGYLVREIARSGLGEVHPRSRTVNWLALAGHGDLAGAEPLARRVHRALLSAAWLPLWHGINPAVVGNRRRK